MAKNAKKSTVRKPTRAERATEQKLTKAYGLLMDQAVSVATLDEKARQNLVISAVMDGEGKERVISRYSDLIWALWPFFTNPNVRRCKQRLDWSRIPSQYREVCKAVSYRWWKVGMPGCTLPGVASLVAVLNALVFFTRYLESQDVASIAEVKPLHISNFVHEQKTYKNKKNGKGYAVGTLTHRFAAIEKLYLFRDQHPDALPFHPWPESSYCEVAGNVGQGNKDGKRDGKTPLIPLAVAQVLFMFAEKILKSATAILDERDKGERSAWKDPTVTAIRDACFFLLGVLTGMRSSELSSIEVGAGRTEIKNGYTFHWVTTVEHKTKHGRVDYLMPKMGLEILRVMERWSEPHRKKLDEKLAAWEAETIAPSAKRLQDIKAARENLKKLFLGNGGGGLTVVSGNRWEAIMKAFAKAAGVVWELAPHQMRRLYAYTFVRHRLGGLLFLKEQFKHRSIDMGQLYASNPHQDVGLYDEILDEMHLYKIETVSGWLHDDELLAGGAGKKIMVMRAHDFPNRAAMIEETSDRLTIRSTGHSWCLAQDEGCGGSGIYEKGRCGGCHNAVIDSNFKAFWQETYQHQAELLVEAQSLGPGDVKRVQRDLDEAARVLKDLGVEFPKEASHGQAARK